MAEHSTDLPQTCEPGAGWTPFSLDPGEPWPILGPRDAHVWRFDLDAPVASAAILESALLPDEWARAARFVFATDRVRYRLTHALLRQLLARYTDREPGALSFTASADGKPELSPNADASGLHFNLSHSGRWAILGVTTAGRIGVDSKPLRTGRS